MAERQGCPKLAPKDRPLAIVILIDSIELSICRSDNDLTLEARQRNGAVRDARARRETNDGENEGGEGV